MHDVIRIQDLMEMLGVSKSTLYRWRQRGVGPNFVKQDRLIFYYTKEVRRWLRAVRIDGYHNI